MRRFSWICSTVSRDRVDYSSDCLACSNAVLEGTAEEDSDYFGKLDSNPNCPL